MPDSRTDRGRPTRAVGVSTAAVPAASYPRGSWVLHAVTVVVGLLFLAPFGYLVVRNLGAGEEFWSAFTSSDTVGPLVRSVVLAVAVTGSATVLGAASAWLVTRTDVPARRVWQLLLALPLVIPSFIGAFALLAAFAKGGLIEQLVAPLGIENLPTLDGFIGAFLVLTLLTYPFVYLPTAARLVQLPRSLEESARLLGRGPFETVRRVVLPQIWGAILAGSLLVFLYTIGDFGAVQLLRYDTLTRSIYSNRLFDPEVSLALSLQLGILAICVVAAERLVRRGREDLDTRRGTRPLQLRLGRWRVPAVAGLSTLVGLALVAPVAVLAYWAFRGLARGSTRATELATDLGGLAEPTLNTALTGVLAAAAAIVLVLPVAYLTVRRRSRLGEGANAVIVGGFALPGLVIALSLVFWALDSPGPIGALYQTLPLLILAYVINFGAMAVRTSQVAVSSVPGRLEDAARMLGVRRVRRFLRVEFPLMIPALLAGAGLVMLSTMKELPATLLLAPIGFQTLATKIWAATEDAFLADAAVAGLVLIALSAVMTWFLVLRRMTAVT